MDMTAQAEALYEFIIKTIQEELVSELSFLVNYDHTRKAIQGIIDMPDRLICLSNFALRTTEIFPPGKEPLALIF